MRVSTPYIAILLFATACQDAVGRKDPRNDTVKTRVLSVDTVVIPTPRDYQDLQYEKREVLVAAPGTKSVIFNSAGSKLYAMNLEGMSLYEFDQA